MKIFRDYFRSYYERCCGHSRSGGVLHNSNLPLNLEMINNNHDHVEINIYILELSTKVHNILTMLMLMSTN